MVNLKRGPKYTVRLKSWFDISTAFKHLAFSFICLWFLKCIFPYRGGTEFDVLRRNCLKLITQRLAILLMFTLLTLAVIILRNYSIESFVFLWYIYWRKIAHCVCFHGNCILSNVCACLEKLKVVPLDYIKTNKKCHDNFGSLWWDGYLSERNNKNFNNCRISSSAICLLIKWK